MGTAILTPGTTAYEVPPGAFITQVELFGGGASGDGSEPGWGGGTYVKSAKLESRVIACTIGSAPILENLSEPSVKLRCQFLKPVNWSEVGKRWARQR